MSLPTQTPLPLQHALREVALASPLDEAALARLRGDHPALVFRPLSDTGRPEEAATAQALLLGRGEPGIDEWLRHAPQLRWIHTVSAGVDRLLTPRLRDSGVLLTNSRGVHAVGIAEHVVALMLAFARGLPALLDAQRAARWTPPPFRGSFELQGQTLAVVGQGAIGGALAAKAAALGLRVLGVRRHAGDEAAVAGSIAPTVGLAALDDVLAEADHVAICLPLTAQTRGLFDAARLRRVKRGAYLYNIGRGAIVDTAALLQSLDDGRLAGAGLDVTDPEPLPADSPLWRLPQVIVTSHTSGATPHNARRALDLFADNLGRARRGEALRNLVDPARGY